MRTRCIVPAVLLAFGPVDLGTPVVESVGAEAKSRFNGKIPSVTVAVRDASPTADAEVSKAWKRVAVHTE